MALIQCPYCGAPVSTLASQCPHCGSTLQPQQSSLRQPATHMQSSVPPLFKQHAEYYTENSDDQNSIGLNILSFLIPLLGLIFWLIWHNSSPIKAYGCAKWAWISIAIEFILGVVVELLAEF